MYPTVGAVPIAGLGGNTICFNNDFFTQYLPRPYPKVRKFHRLPIRSSGIDFFTNFPSTAIPSGLQGIVVDLETLETISGSSVTITTLDENYFVEVAVGTASDYQELLIVFHDGDAVVAFGSPMVKVPDDQSNVVEIKFRTERGRIKNYPYPFDELDRYNRVQVFASMYGVEYPEELTVYNEVSTGRTQKLNSIIQRTVLFETYYLDFPTHEGVAVIFHHDDVLINDRKFVSTEAYNPNYMPEKDLTKGTITLSDSEFSERLLPC